MGLNPIRVTRYICCEVGTLMCRYPEIFRYICDRIIKTKQTSIMNFLKYLGTLVMLIGAGVLVFIGITGGAQANVGLFVGLGLILLGYVLHIVLDKKASEQERLHN